MGVAPGDKMLLMYSMEELVMTIREENGVQCCCSMLSAAGGYGVL
jgi:hypothetical protein